MRWTDLNYRHLMYFHLVVTEGSVSAAATAAGVSQPTVSAQLRRLEADLGGALFARAGRGLVPTPLGLQVAEHAQAIFRSGRALVAALHGPEERPAPWVRVGLAAPVSSVLAGPWLAGPWQDAHHHVVVHAGRADDLLAELAVHRLDVVLMDAPTLEPVHHVRAYDHVVHRCAHVLVARPALVPAGAPLRGGALLAALAEAPLVLPTAAAMARRALDHWLDRAEVTPHVVAESDDLTVLVELAAAGLGWLPLPASLVDRVASPHGLVPLADLPDIELAVHALTTARRLTHPGVLALADRARAASPRPV